MKLYLKTFGCRANQYDTEALRSIAITNGASIVHDAAEADYAVFNSCAVTAEAEADLRQAVRRANRENPALKSLVMGCAAALELRPGRNGSIGALRSLPGVTALFDGADVKAVATTLGLTRATDRHMTQSGARALLRIQDGCDEHCTFCATTIARGANRSRPVASLVEEAEQVAENHNEIVLTGVHIGAYGLDFGSSLSALVATLIERVPGVRFRLSSIEATEVDERLGELLASNPRRLAPYLHAPLQSGSDRVLRRMGRNWYTRRSYVAAVERIASGVNVLGLGADIIAGFPGETEEDHSATLSVARDLPFTSLHVFPYSVRPGTPAEKLDGRIDGKTIARRAAELREVARGKAEAWAQRRSGQRADVIVTGGPVSSRATRNGLTEDYVTVAVNDTSLGRGARFDAMLSLDGTRLTATPLQNH